MTTPLTINQPEALESAFGGLHLHPDLVAEFAAAHFYYRRFEWSMWASIFTAAHTFEFPGEAEEFGRSFEVNSEGCWIWSHARRVAWYRIRGKLRLASTVAYVAMGGTGHPQLELKRLCENSNCVNPGHRQPTPFGELRRRWLKGHPLEVVAMDEEDQPVQVLLRPGQRLYEVADAVQAVQPTPRIIPSAFGTDPIGGPFAAMVERLRAEHSA